MGVCRDSMIYVGVHAGDTKKDAENFLIKAGLLKDGELESEYDGDIQAMFDRGFPLNVQCENYYSGEGYYVGFEVYAGDYKEFDALSEEFEKLTGVKAEVISFTQVN